MKNHCCGFFFALIPNADCEAFPLPLSRETPSLWKDVFLRSPEAMEGNSFRFLEIKRLQTLQIAKHFPSCGGVAFCQSKIGKKTGWLSEREPKANLKSRLLETGGFHPPKADEI
jgi:hypothetical protein